MPWWTGSTRAPTWPDSSTTSRPASPAPSPSSVVWRWPSSGSSVWPSCAATADGPASGPRAPRAELLPQVNELAHPHRQHVRWWHDTLTKTRWSLRLRTVWPRQYPVEGVTLMGRGRQKAKQTKVARKLKYYSPETDYEALERELAGRTQTDLADRYDIPPATDEDDDWPQPSR